MSNIQLADNLRYLRKKNGLTQNDLREMLSISRQAYSNYETDKRTPDLDTLLHLCRFYQVSLNDLVLKNLKGTLSSDKIGENVVPYLPAKSKKTDSVIYLTEEELDFIVQFRTLSKENKQILAGFLSNAKNAL